MAMRDDQQYYRGRAKEERAAAAAATDPAAKAAHRRMAEHYARMIESDEPSEPSRMDLSGLNPSPRHSPRAG